MTMIGRWVPPSQRSRAVALITSTASLSTVFALPMTGYLVRGYGWPVPFYAFGALGLVWAAVWFTGVGSGYGIQPSAPAGARQGIPWRRILRSRAVWAIVVTNFSFNWSFFVLSAWLPSYLKHTFGISLVNAGMLSAAPWLASFLMANVAGYLADRRRADSCTSHRRRPRTSIVPGLSRATPPTAPGQPPPAITRHHNALQCRASGRIWEDLEPGYCPCSRLATQTE